MIELKDDLTINIIREYSKRSLYQFFKLCWEVVESVQFIDNWHIKYICDILQERQEIWEKTPDNHYNEEILADTLINICPAASKSLIISVVLPAWILLRFPSAKILNCTYSFTLSERLAGKRLKLLESEFYQKLVKFKLKNKSLQYIENSKSGSIYSTSIGGTITGLHFTHIICDDLNHPESIFSEAYREDVRRFLDDVIPSRKTDVKRTWSIYVQQRLHDDDATGILLNRKNGKKIKHIIIPAINENGESFFPDRFPLSFFDQQRETLGSISFNAQYLQITQPAEGGIIKKEWLKEIDPLDEKQQIKLTYFIDTAYGSTNKNNKNVDDNAIVGCYIINNNLVVEFVERNKFEFPELIKWLKTNLPNNAKIYIEGKASGKSVIQTLKLESNFNVIETTPKSSKLERKQASSAYFEAGRIHINKFVNNKQLLVEQLIFDNSKHDDISDCVVTAVEQMLQKNKPTVLRF